MMTKETVNLEMNGEGYVGAFGGKKGKSEKLQLKCNLKNKDKKVASLCDYTPSLQCWGSNTGFLAG